MRMFGFIICIFLFFGCSREDLEIPENFVACGHGGSGFQSLINPYVENSEISISRAIDGLGLNAVEVDVQMSQDGEFFLYHDEFLETNTLCSGCIPSMHSSEIRKCNFRSNSFFNSEQKLITLEYLLQKYKDRKIIIFLDMRTENYCHPYDKNELEVMAGRLFGLLKRNNSVEKCPVISSNIYLLETLKKNQEGVITFLDGHHFPEALDICIEKEFDGVCMNNDLIAREDCIKAGINGKKVILFNVKTYPGHLEAIKKSPWCLQSDNVELMLQILKEEG